MSGDTIVQIVTIVVSGIVAVVTLLVRADVNQLKAEITQLRQTVASAHALILQQNGLIQDLTAQNSALERNKAKTDDTKEFTPDQTAQGYKSRPQN